MEQEQKIGNEQFVEKLGNLPVVSSAWNQACDVYSKTKESNAVLRATCNMAEGGIQSVMSTAKPYVEKYQPQIDAVNAYACEKLALMEEQYPVITKPTDEVLKEGKEKCAVVLKPVTDKVNAVKDSYRGIVNKGQETYDATKGKVEDMKEYSMTTVSRTLESPLGKFAMEKVNEALTVSEEYIEKFLPPSEEELAEAEKAPLEVDEVGTMTRVTSLSTKFRERMYQRAMKDLKGLQMRSKEKLDGLNFTVDLIQYAKSGAGDVKDTLGEKYEIAQTKMNEYWEKINDENETDGEDPPETMEGKTIVVARRLTGQVKQGMTTVSGYLPATLQPEFVRNRMENSIKYTEELYQTFKEAQGFDDLPSWLLIQAKEKMSYIQETVSFLTQIFLVSPINWIVGDKVSVQSIEQSPGNPQPDVDSGDVEMETAKSPENSPAKSPENNPAKSPEDNLTKSPENNPDKIPENSLDESPEKEEN